MLKNAIILTKNDLTLTFIVGEHECTYYWKLLQIMSNFGFKIISNFLNGIRKKSLEFDFWMTKRGVSFNYDCASFSSHTFFGTFFYKNLKKLNS